MYKTNKNISDVKFTSDDISKVIKGLNPIKAHGHDEISVRMIHLYIICGDSIILSLKIIFENTLKSGCFPLPDSWKKGNVIPVHKVLATIDQYL